MPINANIPSSRSRSSPNSFSSSGTTETDEKIRKSFREMMVGGEVVEATSPIGSASVRMGSRSRSTRRFMDALSVGESILNNFRSRGMEMMNNNDLPQAQAPPPPPQHNHNHNVDPNSDLFFLFTAGDNSRSNNNNDENDSKVMMVKQKKQKKLQAKVYDGRMHSLPHKKHGPYTCPGCLEVFITSQSYAAHISNSHYRRDETNAQKMKRLMARRPKIFRNTTDLYPQRVAVNNNNLVSSSFAATRSAPPAPPSPNYYGGVVVKVEEEEEEDRDDDDHRPPRHQVPPATAAASSMVVEDEDLNGVPPLPPPPGFEAHHRLGGAKATKIIIKSEEEEW